ncbi:MAG: tRNA (adenosine(37)-N6)-dimethylallyltransferase MiaA [SAR86 cluster bacterium]|uniref:tRNA dimethylallyltransferase n=1 Tax=SAR86 cluster bacterium TaxID=2030880 RepID=A0A2A4X4D2_9GAMM|nr:MAG: tRNA (adenosine(37)-N6)-dimethylallyltransferase MiaA [SAR86 cluster bacterium]
MNSSSFKPNVICLMGPTASGKTSLAVDLVQQHPFQIVSVDSAQIYQQMDIGTGKPEKGVLAIAPHRLIDFIDPAVAYSAAQFRSDAFREIDEILDVGDIPLLVGGTMLYFRVLRDGIADMPHANPEVRSEIEKLAEEQGWEAVHQQLAAVDPDSATRIHPNDPQRIQRALEVYRVSGKTMTSLHAEMQANIDAMLPYNLHFFAIQPEDRGILHDQIETRFRQMLNEGLVDEVQALRSRGDLNHQLPSIKSVGYRQVWQYLDGEIDYDDMVEKSIIATRQLAKRQLTWLRSWPSLQSLSNSSTQSVQHVLKYMDIISI